MTGLVIRGNSRERVLRSTGDPPNGIIAVAVISPEEIGFAVSPSYEPTYERVQIRTREEVGEFTFIDTAEAIEACVGEEEMWKLAAQAVKVANRVLPHLCVRGDFEMARAVIGFLEDLYDEISERSM